MVSLPTPPTKRNEPLPGEAVCSACQQLKDGESKSKKKETDIYLGVFLKQKMLTSPQSFINCSFQMCQRGKGLLGRLKRAERREKRKHAIEWQWASAPQHHAEGWGGLCATQVLLGATEGSPNHRAARARSLRVRKLRKRPRVYILQVTIATLRQPDNPQQMGGL